MNKVQTPIIEPSWINDSASKSDHNYIVASYIILHLQPRAAHWSRALKFFLSGALLCCSSIIKNNIQRSATCPNSNIR